MLVRGACKSDPGDEVIAAYDAPYPDAASKAGARAFPLLIPQTPDAPGAEAGQRVLEALREDERPTLMLWADSDPVLPLATGERFAEAIGRPAPRTIADASHFLQEDQGPLIGGLIADWLTRRLSQLGARRRSVACGDLRLLGRRLEARLRARRAQLVVAARVEVGAGQHPVGLHRPRHALRERARQHRAEHVRALGRLRHPHVDDPELQRLDDRVGHIARLEVASSRAPRRGPSRARC